GSAKLLVHMTAAGEVDSPDLALSGYEIGSGTIGDLMDRFAGLRTVLEHLPVAQNARLGVPDAYIGGARDLNSCTNGDFCGWEHTDWTGNYWWVPNGKGVQNLDHWWFTGWGGTHCWACGSNTCCSWNDATSSWYNKTDYCYLASENWLGDPNLGQIFN